MPHGPPTFGSQPSSQSIRFEPPDQNLTDTVKEETPILAPQPTETVSELWEPEQDRTLSAITAQPILTEQEMSPAQNLSSSSREKIDLTGSQWSVTEPISRKDERARPGPMSEPLNKDPIESIVGNQLESTIQKMVEKILPEIAEKVIKQEIHKLLSE